MKVLTIRGIDLQSCSKTSAPAWFWKGLLLLPLLLFSCAVMPPERPETPETERVSKEPAVPERIMGQGLVPGEELVRFLEKSNSGADRRFVRSLAEYYVEEAAAEGVNHDVAFAQMCHETGFLRFGGLVKPEMNNFCGLGSIGPEKPGETFPDPRTGVRAHIQHLKAYGSEAPLKGELVDPRFRWVRRGSAPLIWDLAGTWATDRAYGKRIGDMLERLYISSFSGQNRAQSPKKGLESPSLGQGQS